MIDEKKLSYRLVSIYNLAQDRWVVLWCFNYITLIDPIKHIFQSTFLVMGDCFGALANAKAINTAQDVEETFELSAISVFITCQIQWFLDTPTKHFEYSYLNCIFQFNLFMSCHISCYLYQCHVVQIMRKYMLATNKRLQCRSVT